MKTAIYLIIFFVFISCSDENQVAETSAIEDNSFFNLEIGNLWVYQRFNSNDNVNFYPTTRIDSVRIVGDTIIDGFQYAIRRHQISEGPAFADGYIRENESGHLVTYDGSVINPGADMNYVQVRNFNDIGEITFQLQNPIDVIVEGAEYNVYPFVGQYVPYDSSLPTQTIYDQYQRGLGLVCQRCTNPSGNGTFEERLIYTNIN